MRSIHLRRTSALAALLLGVALVLGGCSQIPSVVGEALGELVGRDYPAEVLDALAIADDAVTDVNEGVPSFSEDDLAYARDHLGYESYSMLDLLGRCGVALACVGPETMPGPDEERESIRGIHPSGWHSVSYDIVENGSLYNRSHLIGWLLSGENANERNLITGTRFMNADLMLPFEEEVARYIDDTGNHVLYRVTPIFEGTELVARAVEMEAVSLEDDGAGVSFNVVCRNIQPGIGIDYATGDSWEEDEGASQEGASVWEEMLSALQ